MKMPVLADKIHIIMMNVNVNVMVMNDVVAGMMAIEATTKTDHWSIFETGGK